MAAIGAANRMASRIKEKGAQETIHSDAPVKDAIRKARVAGAIRIMTTTNKQHQSTRRPAPPGQSKETEVLVSLKVR